MPHAARNLKSVIEQNLYDLDIDLGLPLLAVSGGADSMAMMHVVAQLRPSALVAYVDHGLRPDGAADGDFVREQAERRGLGFCLLQVRGGQLASLNAGSLEEAARRERYRLLTETAEAQNIGVVATAHHFDDQAETVLHNIARGTGLRGLRGMQSVRDLSPRVQLIRPMLKITRAEIAEFLKAEEIPHREDVTNRSDAHTRNRLRNDLLPALKESVNEAADRHLVQLAEQSQELLNGLDEIAAKILNESILERSANSCRIDRTKLNAWPEAIIRHAMSLLWIQLNWPRRKMTKDHYAQLSHMVRHGQPTKTDFPGRVSAEATAEMVRLRRAI